MEVALVTQPVAWSRAWALIEKALDRPAATTLELEARPVLHTAALALTGAGLVAAAGLASSALLPGVVEMGRQGQAMWSMLLAWGVSAPVLIAAAGHLGLALRPRAMLAALAIALLTAGLVATATVPLLAYLAVIPNAGSSFILLVRALLNPVLALVAGTVVPQRVLRSLDGSRRAEAVSQLFALTTVTLFLLRLATTPSAHS
jgi:hypothetical protein